MATTRRFSETVKADLQANADFRRATLGEVIACMVSGDMEAGKIALREHLNGTVGFLQLGEALGRSPKSLMRMLSATGNPQARTLFEMVASLQKAEALYSKFTPGRRQPEFYSRRTSSTTTRQTGTREALPETRESVNSR